MIPHWAADILLGLVCLAAGILIANHLRHVDLALIGLIVSLAAMMVAVMVPTDLPPVAYAPRPVVEPRFVQLAVPDGVSTFYDVDGRPLAGGTVSVYRTDTFYYNNTVRVYSDSFEVPSWTYSDTELTVPNPNPAVLNSSGGIKMYFDPKIKYRVVVKDKRGLVHYIYDQSEGRTIHHVN